VIAVDESFLAPLGIHRIETPVPFVEAGGPANAYALEDAGGGFTLFDCACGTEEGFEALTSGLKERGLALEGLNRIVVSHGHVDHYGNAQRLIDLTGCELWVHPHDLEKVCGEKRWFNQVEGSLDYFVDLGVPESVLRAMLAIAKKGPPAARQVDRDKVHPLHEGQRLTFNRFEATVLHMPGHTPGLVCLWVEGHKLLFADDHLLAKVSPNPLLDLTLGTGDTKFKALVSYYQSARRAHAMELDCVLPGHGEAFTGHRELLTSLFEFYAARQQRLLKRLEAGPATLYELVPVVFPRLGMGRMFLMLSEVLGNLEVLEADGRVRREGRNPVRFVTT
jgi:glyoxylase-like metal-dependent hydrolase (beta-lactamase superfamily II)